MLSAFMIVFMATLRMGTPLALTALGGTLAEKSGVTNIGLEGIMTMGAFTAVLGSYYTGNPWVGVLLAMFVGVLISGIHSFVAVIAGGNQNISAMALVLLADGISAVVLKAIFNSAGNSAQVAALPQSTLFASIPLIGDFLSRLSPFFYFAVAALVLVHYLLTFTRYGLHVKMVGENPKAAETAGISVIKVRILAVLGSGLLGGLGGAYLSLSQMNLFQTGMIAGRGYLALGAVIMGNWKPLWAFGAAMLFGFFDALQIYLQTLPNFPIPHEFVVMIPYIATLLVLICFANEAKGPAANGKPYSKFLNLR